VIVLIKKGIIDF